MITIQSVMLVLLGVLSAVLAGMMLLPAYRKRAERLTEDRIRRSMPVTEAEIRADKDRLRAQFAIRVHKLEQQVDQAKLAAARQLVEMNRRDAAVATLSSDVEQLRSEREDLVNAKRVLEHTISDRLPRLEGRLREAQDLIRQRDADIAQMTTDTQKSVRALDEAMQINAQQRVEIERLNTALRTRGASNREMLSDPRFEGELALKAEIEALRGQVRDQSSLIERLEAASGGAPLPPIARPTAAAMPVIAVDAAGRDRDARQIAELKAKLEDQATEIARMTAEIGSLKGADATDSRIASKARLSALQAQVSSQTETIQRLRAELAASNERLARQAQHFMDEMRRIGAGTLPASGPRRPMASNGAPAAPPVNAIEQAKATRRTLAERINQVVKPSGDATVDPEPTAARVAELRKVLVDGGEAGRDGEEPIEPTRPARADEAGEPQPGAPSPKSRLLDRIGTAGKTRA